MTQIPISDPALHRWWTSLEGLCGAPIPDELRAEALKAYALHDSPAEAVQALRMLNATHPSLTLS